MSVSGPAWCVGAKARDIAKEGGIVFSDASQVAEPSYRVFSGFFLFISVHHIAMSCSNHHHLSGKLRMSPTFLTQHSPTVPPASVALPARKRIIRSPIDHLYFSFFFFCLLFHNFEEERVGGGGERNGADLLHFMHAGVSG